MGVQKDGSVNAEGKRVSGRECVKLPSEKALGAFEEAGREGRALQMYGPWSQKQQVREWLWTQGGL